MKREDGSVSPFVVVAALALLVMAGLVVDGAGKARALAAADRAAAEAGRAAGQRIDLLASVGGARPRVDARAAQSAARAFLREADLEGTVEISPDGRTLTVEVDRRQRTVFLGLIGIDEIEVTGTATVALVPGIREELS